MTTAGANADWIDRAGQTLVELRGDAPGWGYRPESEPYVEPTALACLALLSHGDRFPSSRAILKSAADWLASIQNDDGSVGLSASLSNPHWPTAYALLSWSVAGSHEKNRRRAISWMLQRKGRAFPRDPNNLLGHDTTLVGWPWIADTHSWVEPTSLAVLALGKEGHGDDDRTAEGLRLLADRAIPTGGWNYGNSAVFDTPLRPRPAPTGWALLALTNAEPPPAAVEPSLAYLSETLPAVRSPQSLCWGLLALAAWSSRVVAPSDSSPWLAEAFSRTARRSDPAMQAAYLLLACGPESLKLLGVQSREGHDKPGS